jgi:F420-dependent oxidoreductase-like protein
MRLALNGNRLVAGGSVAAIAEHAALAAGAGLAGYWLAQHPAGALDPITTLAILGRDLAPIELGTGVVPIWGRHPMAVAAQALTANQATPGKLTIGLGLSHPAMVADHLGMGYGHALRQMRGFLAVFEPLVKTGTVDVTGEVFSCHTDVPVVARPPVDVLVAAMGTRMLELAGARADGTIVSWTGPRTLRDHIVPTIRAAADAADRPSPRVAAIVLLAVTDDPVPALEQVDAWYRFHGDAPSYRAMVEREGVASPSEIAIIGDEATVRARIDDLAEIGVTDLIFGEATVPGSDDAVRTLAFLRDLTSRDRSG